MRDQRHPALRLHELLELVAERADRSLSADRLRAALEGRPETFRLFDPWAGAWRTAKAALEPDAPDGDAWVVLMEPDARPADLTDPIALGLRESVRWLGRGIDPRSPADVSRWHSIVLAERAVRRELSSASR